MLCLSCSQINPAPQTATARAGLVNPHVIYVNDDGTFFPSTTEAQEGDHLVFVGQDGGPLRRTDAIVRVTREELDLADDAGIACLTTALPYDITNADPELDNELTGPARKGISGIFALGPEDPTNWVEGPSGVACADIGADAGLAAALPFETWVEGDGGAGTKLCKKVETDSGKPTPTNSQFLLQSTWENPDVTGAVVRINWEDLYAVVPSSDGGTEVITMSYAKLDAELENAARRGKVVFLEILAGDGIPKWIFTDYHCVAAPCPPVTMVDATATGITPRSVTPIYTRDFGTDPNTHMPTDASCGYDKTMGSPADPNYKFAFLKIIGDVTAHVRASTRHYQALGSLKVSGLNFLTGEIRLPKRCLDTTQLNPDTNASQTTCFCNTAIWATPLDAGIAAFDGGPVVNGGGYTYAIAQNFLNAVENAIYVGLGMRKTMPFMLIQDGFPKVRDATHYDTDAERASWNLGYVKDDGGAIPFDQQTIDALNNGQEGNFVEVNDDGSSAASSRSAGVLFAVMHAGLDAIPVFESTDGGPSDGGNRCPQAQVHNVTLVNEKHEAAMCLTGEYSNELTAEYYGGGGCPNKWAVREGYQGQLIGFQNVNSLSGSDALAASLWNGTLNSNMVFLEVYEKVLWQAEQERRLDAGALSTSAAGYSQIPERQKTLAHWTDELHRRRRTIATLSPHPFHDDPFPDAYVFKLNKPLDTNATQDLYFINPAARCASGSTGWGSVEVTGQ